MSVAAPVTASLGTAGKLERIRQLAEHGLNTPRIQRIEQGTRFDDELREQLRQAAQGDELMTVRTYHPTDEITYARGPFAPEIPVETAIETAEDLSRDWHVLFQEAIDVADTVLAGSVLLSADGRGSYEALAGPFRVRDVEQPPAEAAGALRQGTFETPQEIEEPALRELVTNVLQSGLLEHVTDHPDDHVVLEFNVQIGPVGILRSPTLLWEWRPVGRASLPKYAERPPEVVGDGCAYGVGIASLPTAPLDDLGPARLGGKGWSIAKSAAAGLPVPPALIFSVPEGDVPASLPADWLAPLAAGLEALRAASPNPLVSVRSSPTVSMPGMLETYTGISPEPEAVREAIERVLGSWGAERAVAYRANRGLDGARLAVIVQVFVDGSADDASGTGVGFTRDPADGAPNPVLEYLLRAQGPELVGGGSNPGGFDDLLAAAPSAAADLAAWPETLERLFGDMQEFEFTVEVGRPFLLQSRSGKRSRVARVRIAHDLLHEGIVDARRARELLGGLSGRGLSPSRLDATGVEPIARARVAARGAATGRLALRRDAVAELRRGGKPVVLVSETSDPDDYPLFADLAGVVTRLGGVTSHAAVAALEAEIVALVGASPLRLDLEKGVAAFGDVEISEGEWISIEGAETGAVYLGRLDVMPGDLPPGLTPEILAWAAQTAGDG